MIATVIDHAAEAACQPATCRIGLLGLGNVGSAFARLTRDAADHLSGRGLAPIVCTSLVRTANRERPAARFVSALTLTATTSFSRARRHRRRSRRSEPAFTLGGARSIAASPCDGEQVAHAGRGAALCRLARRRGAALRYGAACIAGVPFLGMFERRALASRASGVTAILNGTSNYILTMLAQTSGGVTFDAALAEAERLGYAEPDPSMDLSGADAAEKLTILIRLFGRLIVDPASIPLDGIAQVDADDLAAAAGFDGALRPLARAAWSLDGPAVRSATGDAVRAHVGPAFLGGSHPLARVAGVTNGIVIDAERGAQCYIGPGAGPDVTAATLLDDVAEIVRERRAAAPHVEPVRVAASVGRPDSGWFVRLSGHAGHADMADLLGSYGIWYTRMARRGGRSYALTCQAAPDRIHAALDALHCATGIAAAAFPAITEESQS